MPTSFQDNKKSSWFTLHLPRRSRLAWFSNSCQTAVAISESVWVCEPWTVHLHITHVTKLTLYMLRDAMHITSKVTWINLLYVGSTLSTLCISRRLTMYNCQLEIRRSNFCRIIAMNWNHRLTSAIHDTCLTFSEPADAVVSKASL